MKFLALLVLALTPSMLSAAEPNAPNDPQASQPFAPGGFIRLHLSPGGYTITNANADAILIEAVPSGQAWLAIRDRLERATRGEDDDRD